MCEREVAYFLFLYSVLALPFHVQDPLFSAFNEEEEMHGLLLPKLLVMGTPAARGSFLMAFARSRSSAPILLPLHSLPLTPPPHALLLLPTRTTETRSRASAASSPLFCPVQFSSPPPPSFHEQVILLPAARQRQWAKRICLPCLNMGRH